jgi:FKBP-type peptidyl-prolyl cis-trans isomerase
VKRALTLVLCLPFVAFAQDAEQWNTTKSGLKYQVISEGKKGGRRPEVGDQVQVHYTGWFTDGNRFDTSRTRGKPFQFKLGTGGVIAGWDEGVQLMTEGSKFKFHVPWPLAYGEQGRQPKIPPKTDLVFEVELIKVVRVPKFVKPNPEKQATTKSGLIYEVVQPGQGKAATPSDGVQLRFALWSDKGRLLGATETMNDHVIAGAVGSLRLGGVPQSFLPEAAALMRPGTVLRCEVPLTLWGGNVIGQQSTKTYWVLELVKFVELPPFVNKPADQLTKTESGLMYEVVKEGTGKQPTLQNQVVAHYSGWTLDGKMFDSSHAREKPATFPLGNVIKGWQEGLQLMKEGAVFRFTIPASLAYGDKPQGGAPAGTLIFLVELKEVK